MCTNRQCECDQKQYTHNHLNPEHDNHSNNSNNVSAIIKTEHAAPDISFSSKIYLKSQADWDGILNDLRELDWPDIYRQVDFVASMNDAFEGIIMRQIPSRVIKFCIKDKAWFNEDCQQANLAKQEAYQLWRRNCSDITWNNYVNLRIAAQETYASAEKEYNDKCQRHPYRNNKF